MRQVATPMVSAVKAEKAASLIWTGVEYTAQEVADEVVFRALNTKQAEIWLPRRRTPPFVGWGGVEYPAVALPNRCQYHCANPGQEGIC